MLIHFDSIHSVQFSSNTLAKNTQKTQQQHLFVIIFVKFTSEWWFFARKIRFCSRKKERVYCSWWCANLYIKSVNKINTGLVFVCSGQRQQLQLINKIGYWSWLPLERACDLGVEFHIFLDDLKRLNKEIIHRNSRIYTHDKVNWIIFWGLTNQVNSRRRRFDTNVIFCFCESAIKSFDVAQFVI